MTLLQVGHHGSDTSSTQPFIHRVAPRYAVISSGRRGEGMNRGNCHPRLSTVRRLNTALGGPGAAADRRVAAFDAAVKCRDGTDANWVDEPVSDRLFITPIDGDMVLETHGDGEFERVQQSEPGPVGTSEYPVPPRRPPGLPFQWSSPSRDRWPRPPRQAPGHRR